jgi:hypothetical protein
LKNVAKAVVNMVPRDLKPVEVVLRLLPNQLLLLLNKKAKE